MAELGPLDRPDFVACLSGIYDLSDREGETLQYVRNIENYTNTTVRFSSAYPAVKDQWHVSAIAKVTSNIKPMFFINSEEDSVPWHQIIDISCALQAVNTGGTFWRAWTIPGSDKHSFAYWNDPIKDTFPPSAGYLVKDRVIGYLKQYLK